MKSSRFSPLSCITLIAAAAIVAGCVPVRGHISTAPYYRTAVSYHDYWYYPVSGTYFDPVGRIHFYRDRGRWSRASKLPAHLRGHRGRHVVVRSPHHRPYEHHAKHRKHQTLQRNNPERQQRKHRVKRSEKVQRSRVRRDIRHSGEDLRGGEKQRRNSTRQQRRRGTNAEPNIQRIRNRGADTQDSRRADRRSGRRSHDHASNEKSAASLQRNKAQSQRPQRLRKQDNRGQRDSRRQDATSRGYRNQEMNRYP